MHYTLNHLTALDRSWQLFEVFCTTLAAASVLPCAAPVTDSDLENETTDSRLRFGITLAGLGLRVKGSKLLGLFWGSPYTSSGGTIHT